MAYFGLKIDIKCPEPYSEFVQKSLFYFNRYAIVIICFHMIYLKYVSAGKFLMPYCLANRLSLIFTKSTPNESVSSSIFSSSSSTLSQVKQLLASKRNENVFVRSCHCRNRNKRPKKEKKTIQFKY